MQTKTIKSIIRNIIYYLTIAVLSITSVKATIIGSVLDNPNGNFTYSYLVRPLLRFPDFC